MVFRPWMNPGSTLTLDHALDAPSSVAVWSLPPSDACHESTTWFAARLMATTAGGRVAVSATNSMPAPVPRLRLYCLSVGLFQCSCTPRLDSRLPVFPGS